METYGVNKYQSLLLRNQPSPSNTFCFQTVPFSQSFPAAKPQKSDSIFSHTVLPFTFGHPAGRLSVNSASVPFITFALRRESLYCTCPTGSLCTVHVQQAVSVLYMSNRQSLYCTCPTGSLCTVHVQQAVSVLYMSNRQSLYCTCPTGSLCTVHVQQAVRR